MNQRVQKVANGATERYDYNQGSQILSEYGATNRDYIWMAGIPVANVDTSGTTSTIAYVTADHLGTPRAIANSASITEWQLPYQGNQWGEQAPSSSGYIYNLGFPGQYFDEETGLNYNGHRDYDPRTGRYLQVDPIGFRGGQWSLYSYVAGSPLNAIDPSGLDGFYLLNPHAVNIPGGTTAGHAAALVGSDQTGYDYYSEDGDEGGNQVTTTAHFDSFADFDQALGSTYPMQMGFHTTPEQDQAMRDYADKHLPDTYSAAFNNCGDFAKHVLKAGGVNVPWNFPTVPNWLWSDLAQDNPNYYEPSPNFPGMGDPNTWKYSPVSGSSSNE
jgi:RHS repeat-associated protein